MKEQEIQQEEKEEGKDAEKEIPLPYCTTAAVPQHHRAFQENEPCDDARSGQDELKAGDGREDE